MDKTAKVFGGILLTAVGFAALTVLGTFFGWLVGWTVGLFFGDTILGIVGQMGLHGITMPQLGAFLGFVGGFLKTKTSATVTAKSS